MVETAPAQNAPQTDGGMTDDGPMVQEPDVYEQTEAGNQGNDIFNDANALEFSVRDPQDFHGHIVYVCKGKDDQGDWECKRRYNEFFALYTCLCARWPGIVLPQCPPKKAMGNKDIIFLQERRFYLERFLRKISQYNFIINSEEFKAFSRPQGTDIENSLKRLVKMSSLQTYERLSTATKCNADEVTDEDRKELENTISEFSVYIKKANPFLKKMQADIAKYLTNKQGLIKSYDGMSAELTKYEETNLAYYVDNNVQNLIMNNTEGNNLTESLKHTVENLRNPFTDLYHWLKGEIYDMSAFSFSLNEVKNIQASVLSVTKKIEASKSAIESIQAGKKTMNTLFKGAGDVHKIQNDLERYERDLEAQTKLYDIMRVYLGRKVLPSFKNDKMRLYSRILQQFHVVEINNSHQLASFWAQVLKTDHIANANLVASQ